MTVNPPNTHIFFKEQPASEWGERPPEGAPVPNKTHSEQAGEDAQAPGPKGTYW